MVNRAVKESLSTGWKLTLGLNVSSDIAQDPIPFHPALTEKVKEMRPDNRPLLVLYAINKNRRLSILTGYL
jgi:hypothetical protein